MQKAKHFYSANTVHFFMMKAAQKLYISICMAHSLKNKTPARWRHLITGAVRNVSEAGPPAHFLHVTPWLTFGCNPKFSGGGGGGVLSGFL